MNRSPIFVGGAGRSGTTLVRVILDSHPNIFCGPEIKIIPLVCRLWHDMQTAYLPTLREWELNPADLNRIFGRTLTDLLDKARERSGKPRVAEKSPNNIFFFEHLNYLFPDSPLIHIIRDGRDVACSLLTMNWFNPKTGERLECTTNMRSAAKYWKDAVKVVRTVSQKPSVAKRLFELRYEDLVAKPEETLRPLFAFLGEAWEPGVLKFHEQKRKLAGESSAQQVSQELYKSAAGRWQKDMKPEDRQAFKEAAGDTLVAAGYADNLDW